MRLDLDFPTAKTRTPLAANVLQAIEQTLAPSSILKRVIVRF